MKARAAAIVLTTLGLGMTSGGSTASMSGDLLLLVDSAGRLTTLGVKTGQIHLLARAEEATWSPNGQRVALTRGDLFIVRPDGRGLRRLTGDDLVQHDPTWSPDGKTIAVLEQHPGTGDLGSSPPDDVAVVDVGSGGLRQLTHDGTGKTGLSWSPDGTRLVYNVSRGPGIQSLASISADTGRPTEPESVRPYPIWSPRGRRLAYVVAEAERISLFASRADGLTPRIVFRGARDISVDGVTWSPNGRFLAFSYGGWSKTRRRLKLVDTTTGSVRSLTGVRSIDYLPSWSPDSTRLAFERYEPGSRRYVVATVDRRDGRVDVLARSRSAFGSPQWRPRSH